MEQVVVVADQAGGKYTIASCKSTRLPLKRIEFFLACSFSRISSIRLDFAFMKMTLVTTNSSPYALKHPSRCVSLSFPLSRTDSLRCSFNLVCLVAPAHHEDYGLYYIRRLCFYCLGAVYVYPNSLPQAPPPPRIIDRR